MLNRTSVQNAPMSGREIQIDTGILELSSAVYTGGASLEAAEAGTAVKAILNGIATSGLFVSGSSRIIGTAAGAKPEDIEKGSTAVTTVTNPTGLARRPLFPNLSIAEDPGQRLGVEL